MSAQILELDTDQFMDAFDREPYAVNHALSTHPLFALSRLVELCQQLPPEQVEYNRGDIPVDQVGTLTPANGLSPDETIRRIAENGSWLVLKNVEHDPAYRALLQEALVQVGEVVPDMNSLEGFVFISSPGAVTPYHMDPEHNFLLQIQGSKKVSIFDPRDRELVAEEVLETFWGGNEHRNIQYKEEFQSRAMVFELTPGKGVHFPVTAPHWVEVGPEVSISFSVTFRSGLSKRHSVLHNINRTLRKFGVSPSPVGASALSDLVKYFVYRAVYGVKNRILSLR